MDLKQLLILVLAQVPTIITVIIGIWLDSRQFTAIKSHMTPMENLLTNVREPI